jgi:CO/xanthine dehydrogenase FAD-binding subunit
VGDFFLDIFQTALAPDEILTSVSVPVRQASEGWAVQEFARRSGDFAIVAVGVRLAIDGDGRIAMTRVCLAGVGPRPLRLRAVEDSLIGQWPDPDVLARAAERVASEITPASDVHASAAYRSHLAVVLSRRALTLAARRAQGEHPHAPRNH